MDTPGTRAQPIEVRVAAICVLLYGGAILANALLVQGSHAVPLAALAVRAGLRAVGAAVIAWGLFTGARWAWWVSVIGAGLCFVVGLVTFVRFLGPLGGMLRSPERTLTLMGLGLACLLVALACLASPRSRAAFG